VTRVLVTGATGTLGKHVVAAVAAAGHQISGLSRRARQNGRNVRWLRGDLLARTGLDAAVDGADVIVHCATQGTGDKDFTAAGNLLAAAGRAGVGHLIYVSIVGIDRIPLPYYKVKLRTEQLLAASGVAHTVLRATQFHDLIATTFHIQRYLPVMMAVRGVSFQPIDTRDVAGRLVELVDAQPAGRVADIGGPEVREHADLARGYLAAQRSKRPVLTVPLPGRIASGYKSGANLVPGNPAGKITFAEYLAQTG
jgi:uncharacterized protein YbjT (DUF2867 family)